MDQRISLYLASRVRFAGLPNAQPALDSTSREKWYQHRPTAAYRLGLGFGRSDKLRSRAAVQLKGAGKSLREKPAAIVAFGIADLPLQPVLQKPPGATNSPTNSADEAEIQTGRPQPKRASSVVTVCGFSRKIGRQASALRSSGAADPSSSGHRAN